MKNNKFKAIGFDHTGVIAGDSARLFHEKVCHVLQIEYPEFRKVYQNHNLDFNAGRITKKEFWTTILRELKKETFYYEVMEVVDAPRLLNNSVMQLIYDLKEKGYKLGILSNDTVEGGVVIRKDEGLEDIFDLILISAETGLAKPTVEAFTDFAEKLGVTFDELVFIDDAIFNIEAADKLGITTVKCDDPNNLRNQLEDLEVL